MASKLDHTPTVRAALDKARAIQKRQPQQTPKLDAIVAVLNSDLIDRTTGLTLPAERTPGLDLAESIAA